MDIKSMNSIQFPKCCHHSNCSPPFGIFWKSYVIMDPSLQTTAGPSTSVLPAGEPKDKDLTLPTLWSTLTSLTLQDFVHAPAIPCTSRSLLTGVIAGLSLGLLRFLRLSRPSVSTPPSSPLWRSAGNWGLGGFVLSSSLAWEYCRYQKRMVHMQMDYIANELKGKETPPSSSSSLSSSSSSS